MSDTEAIVSDDGHISVRIIERHDGYFALQRFEWRYDEDEEVHFWVRSLPDPTGIFESAELAEGEAKTLLLRD